MIKYIFHKYRLDRLEFKQLARNFHAKGHEPHFHAEDIFEVLFHKKIDVKFVVLRIMKTNIRKVKWTEGLVADEKMS